MDKIRFWYMISILGWLTFPTFAQDTLSIQGCIERALSHNPSIKNAELTLQLSHLQHKARKADRLPTLTATMGNQYAWGRSIDPSTNGFVDQQFQSVRGGLATQATLFSGLRNWYSIALARKEFEINQTELQKVQNEIQAAVLTQCSRVLYLQEILRANQEQLINTTELAQIAELKWQVEKIAEGDLLKVKLQQATEQADLFNTEKMVTDAYLELKQLLALPLETTLYIRNDSAPITFAPPTPSFLPAYAYQHPAYQTSVLRMEKTKLAIQYAQAGRYPTLGWSTSYHSNYSNANTQQSWEEQVRTNRSYGLGLSFSIPLFSNGKTTLAIQESKLLYRQSLHIQNIEYARIARIIIQAGYTQQTAYARWQSTEQAWMLAKKNYELESLRYQAGRTSSTEWLVAKNLYIKAQADKIQGYYELFLAIHLLGFYQNQEITF